MDLPNYEKLIFKQSEVKHLTEDEMLDKINRDIAVWQSSQLLADESAGDGESSVVESLGGEATDEDESDDDQYYLESVE